MARGEDIEHLIVPRITQLDAVEYDESIKDLLSAQVLETEKFLKPGSLSNWKPEIEFLVDVLIFRNSVNQQKSTFGQDVLNLKFNQLLSKKKRTLYFILCVLLPYCKRRYDELSRNSTTRVVNTIWNVTRLMRVINFIFFLREGLYPTLTDRLLRIKYAHSQKPNRGVPYNYMVRELIWNSFMELMVFTLPLVNVQAVKRKIKWLFSGTPKQVQIANPVLELKTGCALCQMRPNAPCRISIYCPHVACYLCLKGNILADEKFCCPTCGVTNTAVKHFQYITL